MSSPTTVQTATRERIVGRGHEAFERVRARVAALSRLDTTDLDVPTRVTMLPDDGVAVVEPGHDAVTLQTVLDTRGSLKAGECVWVGMAIAEALAVLHRAGLAHGAIRAASVRLPSSGVLLGDLVDGDDNPTAADDIAALGALLASCVNGPEAERVRAWTEPMTHDDPGTRPTAAMVARALGSCAHPEPLRHTPRGVASSMRAAASPLAPVRRLPEARAWRWGAATRTWALRGAIAVVAAAMVAAVGWAAISAVASDGATAPRHAAMAPRAQDPVWVAQRATQARFEAWQHSDAEQLVRWTAEGSQARAEAEVTAEALASGRMRVADLSATIDRVVERSTVDGPRGVVIVTVDYTLSDHTVTLDGTVTRFRGYAQTIDLELERTAAGWLVTSATTGEAGNAGDPGASR